tara:strand:- start:278 stop:700 length:423 start_codon:yes stop_codon:yes gene_type:complete
MIEVRKEQITLENVSNSNYWDLIGLIIWSHYSEKHHQDDSMISFEEKWYGKRNNDSGGQYSPDWKNPSHKAEGYTRTMTGVVIKFKRPDYTARITISLNGCVHHFGIENSDDRKTVHFNKHNSLAITNWMLSNDFCMISK